jgi:lipoate-protein ligase A
MKNNKYFSSPFTIPLLNLAIEDYLFRKFKTSILFIYRNSPSVIIGRNQNPFIECNTSFLEEHSIPLVRRQSGGGTVVHDLGNTNFCLMMPRSEFTLRKGADLAARALNSLDIPAVVNEKRNDIFVGNKKVSGSAYRIINDRAFHHGTMLINSDLEFIKKCLQISDKKHLYRHNSITSVPSPITNLSEYSLTISHDLFCKALIKEFLGDENIIHLTEDINKHVVDFMSNNSTWEWKYGQTPDFTRHFILNPNITIILRCRRGVIEDISVEGLDEGIKQFLDNKILNTKYNELKRNLIKSDKNIARMIIDQL